MAISCLVGHVNSIQLPGWIPDARLCGIIWQRWRKLLRLSDNREEESSGKIHPIIAKILAVRAAFSSDSRMQGACVHRGDPARPDQKLTCDEFRKQHEIVIASCKSWGEMVCRVVIDATVGFTGREVRMEKARVTVAQIVAILMQAAAASTVSLMQPVTVGNGMNRAWLNATRPELR